MLILIGLGVFFLTVVCMFFMGLWSNTLTLCNILLSTLFASTLWEPVANTIDAQQGTYTYVADFVAVWGVFFLSFGIIRILAELLGKYRVQFNGVTDYLARTFVCLFAGWILMCFTMFTMHMAPVQENFFSGGPTDQQMGIGPDRLWLRFMHSRSKGALAEGQSALFLPPYDVKRHPDDPMGASVRVFDPQGDFVYRYRNRRKLWGEEQQLRVPRR